MSLVDVSKLNYFVLRSLPMHRNKPTTTKKKKKGKAEIFKLLILNTSFWMHSPRYLKIILSSDIFLVIPTVQAQNLLSLHCSKYPTWKQAAEEIAWFSDSSLVCSSQVRATEIGTLSITVWIWKWKCKWKCLVSTISVDLSFTGEKYLFYSKKIIVVIQTEIKMKHEQLF